MVHQQLRGTVYADGGHEGINACLWYCCNQEGFRLIEHLADLKLGYNLYVNDGLTLNGRMVAFIRESVYLDGWKSI